MKRTNRVVGALLALWMSIAAAQIPLFAEDETVLKTEYNFRQETALEETQALDVENPVEPPILETNAVSFTAVKDLVWKPEHEEYINTAIQWHAENSTKVKESLENGKNAVFLFDGVSKNLNGATIVESGYKKGDNRYNHSAVCVVVSLDENKEPKVIYACEASTMPDNVRGTNVDNGIKKGRPTVVDGIYDLRTVNHTGSGSSDPYAAHDIQNLKVIRCWKNTDDSASEVFEYNKTGIHVHATKNNDSLDKVGSADSTGCVTIGRPNCVYPNDYNHFMNVMGFSGNALLYTNGKYVGETYGNTNDENGVIIIDHYNYKYALPTIFGDDTSSAAGAKTGSEIADIITEESEKWYNLMNGINPETFTLTGTIRNATADSAEYGNGIAGVSVTCKKEDGTIFATTTTAADGTFSITFTEEGKYLFVLEKAGFQSFTTAALNLTKSSPSIGIFTMMEEETEAEIIASGTCGDNLTWTLDDAGTLTISGEGAMKDYSNTDTGYPWNDYINPSWIEQQDLSGIKKAVLCEGVTTLASEAFVQRRSRYSFRAGNVLENIQLPETLDRIEDYAFWECNK